MCVREDQAHFDELERRTADAYDRSTHSARKQARQTHIPSRILIQHAKLPIYQGELRAPSSKRLRWFVLLVVIGCVEYLLGGSVN